MAESGNSYLVNYVLGDMAGGGGWGTFDPTYTASRLTESADIINETVAVINAAINPRATTDSSLITSGFNTRFSLTLDEVIRFDPITSSDVTLIPFGTSTVDCSDIGVGPSQTVDATLLNQGGAPLNNNTSTYNINSCETQQLNIHTGQGEGCGYAGINVLYQVYFKLVPSIVLEEEDLEDQANLVIERSLYIIANTDIQNDNDTLGDYLCENPPTGDPITRALPVPTEEEEAAAAAAAAVGGTDAKGVRVPRLNKAVILLSKDMNRAYEFPAGPGPHTKIILDSVRGDTRTITESRQRLLGPREEGNWNHQFHNHYGLSAEQIEFTYRIIWAMDTFTITPSNTGDLIYDIDIVSNYAPYTYGMDFATFLETKIMTLLHDFFTVDNAISDVESIQYADTVVRAPICFPAGTLIQTDQGEITIENIDIKNHTINNKSIIEITKTISSDKYLVYFKKHALGYNIPNKKTIMTKEHRILLNNELIEANDLVENKNVKKIKYNGELLYNVLMDNHEVMNVNNLVCETLHPASYLGIKLFNGEPKSFTILKKFGKIFNTVNNLNN